MFEDLIKITIYSSPNIFNDVLEHFDEEGRKIAWKGIILSEALKSIEIKKIVRSILFRQGYPMNISLKEFYDLSKQKIQLNFMAVSSVSNTITVLNHITRPNMPLWAAIMATSSLPNFFKTISDHK